MACLSLSNGKCRYEDEERYDSADSKNDQKRASDAPFTGMVLIAEHAFEITIRSVCCERDGDDKKEEGELVVLCELKQMSDHDNLPYVKR